MSAFAGRRRFPNGWGDPRCSPPSTAWVRRLPRRRSPCCSGRDGCATRLVRPGRAVDRVLREVMVFESQAFLWPWAYAGRSYRSFAWPRWRSRGGCTDDVGRTLAIAVGPRDVASQARWRCRSVWGAPCLVSLPLRSQSHGWRAPAPPRWGCVARGDVGPRRTPRRCARWSGVRVLRRWLVGGGRRRGPPDGRDWAIVPLRHAAPTWPGESAARARARPRRSPSCR